MSISKTERVTRVVYHGQPSAVRTPRREARVRNLAKCLVVLGILLAIGGAVGTEVYRMNLQYDARYAFVSPKQSDAMRGQASELTWLPWVIAGAATSAFGILLLAILSRPQPQG